MDTSKGAGTPAAAALGRLEAEVMDLVWDRGEATVRDVYRVLLARREVAYTTVMTAMSNLARKGMLTRSLRNRAYVYRPTLSKDEFTRSRVAEMVDVLLGRLGEPAMNYLVDRVSQVDPRTLDELEQAIKRLRKQNEELPGD